MAGEERQEEDARGDPPRPPQQQPAPASTSEPPIEPDRFDAIVVSTGLPEVLIASALAAAGKSVLLLDAHDYYGGAWASVSGRAFSRLLFGGGGGDDEAATSPPSSSSSSLFRPLPCHALPPLRATGVTTWREPSDAHDEQQAAETSSSPPLELPPLLQRCRALDLLPRALYQGEPLVDGLVAARAHPYVEFKLVEGSYVLDAGDGEEGDQGARGTAAAAAAAAAQRPPPSRRPLLRIPASKAHIFADRGLAPREKRAMMRFLAAGLEASAAVAAAGEDATTTTTNTASVAAAAAAAQQGAFPAAAARSQEASSLVAALARRDVPLAHILKREGLPRRVRDFVLYGIAMACGPEEEDEGKEGGGTAGDNRGRRLSAADGRDALALYASSLGRFDAPPPPLHQQQHQLQGGLLSVAPPPPPPASAFMAAAHGAGSLVEAFVRHAAVRGALTVLRRPVEGLLLSPPEEGSAVVGVRLRAGGQELRAGAVVGGRAALSLLEEEAKKSGGRQCRLARCVAVLDGPLRPEGGSGSAVDTFALVVAPPEESSGVVTRGLLLGPAAQAGPPPPQPPGSPPLFLLYLVADVSHLKAEASSAEAVLAPVLRQLGTRVIEAVFYTQQTGGNGGDNEAPTPTSSGLVVCPGPEEVAPGVAGYVKTWAAAEALYRRHFPGLPWFGEEQRGGGGDGGGGGDETERDGRRGDDGAGEHGDVAAREESSDPPTEGLDAIDELSSALAALGEELGGGKG